MQLEVRLAEKEESLLEKDLIFEQVSRLSDRIKGRADSGKNDTLTLAKDVRTLTFLSRVNRLQLYESTCLQVNELQAKIKAATRKMMAYVSELSMHQANALKLQQVRQRHA